MGTAKQGRQYDVVVFGATGFVGRLVAEYLAGRFGAGRDVKWALAGRNREKLEAVREGLATIDPAAKDLPLLIADARDASALKAVVQATRVVTTTVGPYALYGRELVAACAENGTDYCDLTGEVHFVREMIDRHHAAARDSGARIVCSCGFDSIPSDLGTLMLQSFARERFGGPCHEVKFLLEKVKGGFSGGTIASLLNLIAETVKHPEVRKLVLSPYALDPEGPHTGPDRSDQMGVRYDNDAAGWTAPFLMAPYNTRIVRRTNALLSQAYGKDFRYSEVTATGSGAMGWLRAGALAAGVGGLLGAVGFPPTRFLLSKTVLPKPGEGPSKESRERGMFLIKLVGIGQGFKVGARVVGQGDPGYNATARMLGEASVCLARDVPDVQGGLLTPAAGLGMRLVDRLRAAGMTFEVSPIPESPSGKQSATPVNNAQPRATG